MRQEALDEENRLRVAAAIKKHLHSIGKSRKESLYDKGLSVSTIDKALAGDFSEATLNRIEAILGVKFTAGESIFADQAPDDLGNYTFKSVEHLQGDYIVARPCFANSGRLNVYGMTLSWDEHEACLVFTEKLRGDPKYTQRGKVFIPFGKPFFSLVTTAKGSVRLINLYLPDGDGVCRGVVSTLHPQGGNFLPATSPIILKRIDLDEVAGTVASGFLMSDAPGYGEYKSLLDSITDEGFAIVVNSTDIVERRRGLSLVG